MEMIDLFLREHAAAHSKAVAPADFNMDWLVDGLSDDDWRARPHRLNSLAWLFWHIARVEDACVSLVVAGQPQLLDDAWAARLKVDGRGDSGEMSKAEVGDLSAAIDIGELREYRNEVGRRTRVHVGELWPARWEEPLAEDDIRRAAGCGVMSGDESDLVGKPREALLFWWGLNHTIYHLGQAAMVRSALKR